MKKIEYEPELLKHDYRIHVNGQLYSRKAGLVGCDVIVDDGCEPVEDEDGFITAPLPRYGCTGLGPLNQIDKDGRFKSFYWIHLLGADPKSVPIPEFVTLRVHTSPGIWESKRISILPSMVRAKTDKEMYIDVDTVEWIAEAKPHQRRPVSCSVKPRKPIKVFYVRSGPQSPDQRLETSAWGNSLRYIEFGEDGFPSRSVDEYENGYLVRYDREHWTDQFGSLPDFRYGKTWRKHWGKPLVITREEFESKWDEAGKSLPSERRKAGSSGLPPWIELFQSGRWKGQQ